MTNYPIGDTLVRLKNAYLAGRSTVVVKHSGFITKLLTVLKKEKYISGFKTITQQGHPAIKVNLRYLADEGSKHRPAIQGIKLVSKPGRRVYVGYDKIPPVFSGLGINILSTSQGVLTGAQAKAKKVGGELICQVW